MKDIPIVIVSFNRLTYLIKCINSIKRLGYNNIFILDNNSSYEPLLRYYEEKSNEFNLIKLSKNLGHEVMDKMNDDMIKNIMSDYYVYTDNDIELSESTPPDFIETFIEIQKMFNVDKVGCALKIDDLFGTYAKKNEVINWESKFWEGNMFFKDIPIYRAPIDTTFALVKPNTRCIWTNNAIRVGAQYAARHLPWYENTKNISAELINYNRSALQNINHW